MVFEDDLALVNELLTEFGETTAVLRRRTPGSPSDALKPWEPGAPVLTNNTPAMVFLDERSARRLDILVSEGEQAVLVDPTPLGAFEPNPETDVVVREDGSQWQIVRVDPLNPNGETILYTLVVRR